jgi:predicted DNA-binding protein with PD1-like motif
LYLSPSGVIHSGVNVAESTRTRHLVGRLDRGADILTQLLEVCRAWRVHAGSVRAVGSLEDAVVGSWDQHARAPGTPRRFAAPVELLSLDATISEQGGVATLHAFAALSRNGDNGIELLGGRLVSGKVFACEFVIDAYDDLTVPSVLDATTGLHLWAPRETVVTEAPAPSFEAAAKTTWSDVVTASEEKAQPAAVPAAVPQWSSASSTSSGGRSSARDNDENDAPLANPPSTDIVIRPGDLIDHPKFGRITVERIDGDQEFVSARMRNQRLIRLSLEVLSLEPAGQAEGKTLFKAVFGGDR